MIQSNCNMFKEDNEFLKHEIEEVEQSLRIISIFKYRNKMPVDLIRTLDNKIMHLKSIFKKIGLFELLLHELNIDENIFCDMFESQISQGMGVFEFIEEYGVGSYDDLKSDL